LIVGGGFAGQPPAGLSCFAGQHIEEGTSLMIPRHRLKNIINNTQPRIINEEIITKTTFSPFFLSATK
jgi:hypothetical protein